MANGREEAARGLVNFFFSFLNRAGSVRVGRFRHTKTGNQTELDIFLNILTGLIDFFTGSIFSVNFFLVFSVKSVFQFFCSPLVFPLLRFLVTFISLDYKIKNHMLIWCTSKL